MGSEAVRESYHSIGSEAQPGTRPGLWALADQALVSAGSFVLNVLLVRHLSSVEYGTFGLYWSGVLLLNAVHSSLLIYPLSTAAASGDAGSVRGRAAAVLYLTLMSWAPLAAALAVVGTILGAGKVVFAALAAVVCRQAQETVRRGLMAALRLRTAMWGDALSYLGPIVVVWLLVRSLPLTAAAAFWVLAATSMIAAVLQSAQLRLGAISGDAFRAMARSAVRLGGWSLIGTLISILSSQMLLWAIAAFRGASEGAALLAVWTVLGATHPLLFGMSNVIYPAAAAAYGNGGEDAAWREVYRHWKPGVALAGFYLLGLIAAPDLPLRFLYGTSSPYSGLQNALRWGAAAYLLLFFSQGFGFYLASMQKVRAGLLIQAAGAVTGALAGLPLVAGHGVSGACAGLALVNLAKLVTGWALSGRGKNTIQLSTKLARSAISAARGSNW